MTHVLDICSTVSPLALIDEVRERPWNLWRPGYLVHQWGSRMRLIWLEDPSARLYGRQLHRWSWQRSDRAMLADWLRALRDLSPVEQPEDTAMADAAAEGAAMALALGDTGMALDLVRGGLATHTGDERLRVLEIQALYEHGELTPLESQFALASLPLTDERARTRAEDLSASLAPSSWRSAG